MSWDWDTCTCADCRRGRDEDRLEALDSADAAYQNPAARTHEGSPIPNREDTP